MTDTTAAGSTLPPNRGVSSEAMRLLGSLTRHLQSLAALAGLEGREAIGVYVRAAVAFVAALLLAAFGYVFLLLFIAFALDRFLGVPWVWIALGYTFFHFLGAFLGLLYMKKHVATPVFRATAEEIRRDVAAMRAHGGAPVPLM